MRRLPLLVTVLVLTQGCEDTTSPPIGSKAAPLVAANSEHTATHLWAKVRSNGTLRRGRGVASVSRLGAGQYEITFNQNVVSCAYVATTQKGGSEARTIFPASGHASVNGVYVETKSQLGVLTDTSFDLVVTCGQLGIRFAVVGYSANLVRATPGTTLTYQGSGGYFITFASSTAKCSYIATVADPGNGTVVAPMGVSTGYGFGNDVFVQTHSLSGGQQENVPFHLALICSTTQPSSRFAVVRNDGSARWASSATTSFRVSHGRYAVASDRNLTTCAVVATRGSASIAFPPPGTVEAMAGPSLGSVGFELRKLLFLGGGLTNLSFHAAMVC